MTLYARIVLREPPDREALSRWAYRSRWILRGDYAAKSIGQPREIVWIHHLDHTSMHLLDDGLAGEWYFQIRGLAVPETEAHILASFDTFSVDEARALIRSEDPDQRARGVMLVCLMLGGLQPFPVELALNTGLVDESPLVRKRAALSAGYTSEARWVDQLEALAHSDPDPEVAEEARRIAAGLRAHEG